jgi:ADP-ribosyl-[dinitrogen reductase] hydrolase
MSDPLQASAPSAALPASALPLARDCLMVGALGDALGYAVEFDSWEKIRVERGAAGIEELDTVGGEAQCSDDTQMMLFLHEALLESAGPDDDVARARAAFIDWAVTQSCPYGPTAAAKTQSALARAEPNLWQRQAPGMTCLSSIAQGALGSMRAPLNDSKGCGGVMRAAPAAFPAFWREKWSAEDAWTLGAAQAALTHGHPEGWASAGAMAALTHGLLCGQSLEDAADQALRLTQRLAEGRAPLTVELGRKAVALGEQGVSLSPATLVDSLGLGWVGEEAFAVGLHCAFTAKRKGAAAALRQAANHSGDSDSTASIAGQIIGAAGLSDEWCALNAPSLDLRRALGTCVSALAQRSGAAVPLEIEAPAETTGGAAPRAAAEAVGQGQSAISRGAALLLGRLRR